MLIMWLRQGTQIKHLGTFTITIYLLITFSSWFLFSLREEVASFLSHYCASQNPLKADNVSEAFFLFNVI